MLVILEIEFNLCAVYSSGLIDFLYCQLCAVLYSHAVHSRTAGYRADAANLEHAACRTCVSCCGIRCLASLCFCICRSSLCCFCGLCRIGTTACCQ